jgi:hypothetical protein
MALPEESSEAILNAAFYGYADDMAARVTPDLRFAHYTSAETALRIIRGNGTDQALWLRNATEMNDFSEIEFGQACLEFALGQPEIEDRVNRLSEALGINISTQVVSPMGEERHRIKSDTFLLCLSEHDSRDDMGVLSMWRAYGGDANVCLLFNTDALTNDQEAYDVHITAVDYDGEIGFLTRFTRVLNDVDSNLEKLKLVDHRLIVDNWKSVLDDMVLSTKHPGFKEEQEWRIIYRRNANTDIPAPPHKIEVVGGIAQVVHYLPLVDVPEKGVTKANIQEILDRVIVGPTANPILVREAFVAVLAEAGLSNPEHRVVTCNIPLRR